MISNIQKERHEIQQQCTQDRKVNRVPVLCGVALDSDAAYNFGIFFWATTVSNKIVRARGVDNVPFVGLIVIFKIDPTPWKELNTRKNALS